MCFSSKERIPRTGLWKPNDGNRFRCAERYWLDKAATCTEEGNKSIHCAVCGAIDEATITTIPKTEHTYGEWKTTKEATCTETGFREKACADCKDKITEAIPALGHNWKEDYTIDKTATCMEEGSKSIHCALCNIVKENSEIEIDARGHNWSEPAYVWAEDNSSVTATRTCRHDSTHKETESASTISKVTRAATYTSTGQTTYTAEFTNSAFATQIKIENNIPQLQKKDNPLVVKTKKATVKLSKLKKKTQKLAANEAFAVSGAQGKVTFKVNTYDKKAKKKISVSSAGKVTVKKGLKKGTYKVKVNVTAAGNREYKCVTKTVTCIIKVK